VVAGLAIWFSWLFFFDPRWLKATFDRWFNSALGTGSAVQDIRTGRPYVDWLDTVGDIVIGWETVLLLAVALLAWVGYRRRPRPRLLLLFIIYPLLAIILSLVVRLREPRHVIGIIPFVALAIGLLIDWQGIVNWLSEGKRRWLVAPGLAIVLLLAWGLSPVRLPREGGLQNLENWWEPNFQTRMFELNRYYGVLKEVGEYLAEHTPTDEIIVIVHEGTAVSFFANRPYRFLYTSDFEHVISILEDAKTLVYDRDSFFLLTDDERASVQEYIETNFVVDKLVQDEFREVTIYSRSGGERQ
jgi:hypothetical protein